MKVKSTHKTHWLVGASSGIGRDMAVLLAKQGHKVIVSARRSKELEQLTHDYPDNIYAMTLDVSDHRDIEALRKTLELLTDHIDVLIYNAGTASYTSGNDSSYLTTTRAVYDVNFFGFLYCLDLALPLLKKAPGKKLIAGVCSLSAYLALPRAEAYGSSKAALVYFLDSLRTDLYEHNIDVTVINPGFVDTPMTQKNDFPMPGVWSSSKAAAYIVKHLPKHKAEIRFPFLLIMALRIASCLPKKFLARHIQFMVKN